MMRLSALLCAAVCAFAITGTAVAGDKKGVAIGPRDGDAAETIRRLDARWYYTWSTEPIESAGPAQFVPMIWSDGAKADRQVAQIEAGPKPCALLAFNEPDGRRQADMSVDEAVGA
jgi:hypothetical protein